jgi:hypothetical protein
MKGLKIDNNKWAAVDSVDERKMRKEGEKRAAAEQKLLNKKQKADLELEEDSKNEQQEPKKKLLSKNK